MLGGVTVSESNAQKDELTIEGTDIEYVSQSGTMMNYCVFFILILKKRFFSGVHPGYLSGTEQRYSQILRRDLCFREDYDRQGLIIVIALRGCCITYIKTCMLHVYFPSLMKACIYAPRTVSNVR